VEGGLEDEERQKKLIAWASEEEDPRN
jgi:hypothetical protein